MTLPNNLRVVSSRAGAGETLEPVWSLHFLFTFHRSQIKIQDTAVKIQLEFLSNKLKGCMAWEKLKPSSLA